MTCGLVHKSCSVGETHISWAEAGGPSDLPAVVMLHGLSDSHLTWKKIAPELFQSRRVLMPDLPGHGQSGRPDASYTLTWYAEVMAEWMNELGLKQVDMVGHSFGGGVAQMLLLWCPQRIRRLGLISSGGLGREIALVLRLASIPYLIEYLGQPFMAAGTKIALTCARDGRSAEDIAALCAMCGTSGSARAFARTVRDIIDWRGQRRTCYQRIHEVTELPPIGVFWGARDPIIPVTHGRKVLESFEGARLVIFEDCGHFVHHEQPLRLARELSEFLDDPQVPAARARLVGA